MSSNDYGDPSPASTAYIGLVGTIIFVLTVIYLTALYYQTEEQLIDEKVVSPPVQFVEDNRAEQRDVMADYQYYHDYIFEGGQGRVSIPVEDAKEYLLQEWGDGQ